MSKGNDMGERLFRFVEWCFFIPIIIIVCGANTIREYLSDRTP
jgi:hypothetical protein